VRGIWQLASIALFTLGVGGAHAQGAPANVVAAIYKEVVPVAIKNGNEPGPFLQPAFRRRYFTASLIAVCESIDKIEAKGEEVLDADPITSSNGMLDRKSFTDFTTKTTALDAAHALVVATFGLGVDRRNAAYRMALEGGQWRVDDIGYMTGPKNAYQSTVRFDLAEAQASPKN
jgi:hypothetical protein